MGSGCPLEERGLLTHSCGCRKQSLVRIDWSDDLHSQRQAFRGKHSGIGVHLLDVTTLLSNRSANAGPPLPLKWKGDQRATAARDVQTLDSRIAIAPSCLVPLPLLREGARG